VVRLDQEAGAAAAQEDGEECPTFFADYFAGEEGAQQASAPAPRRASKATADAQGEEWIDPPGACLQVYDPCNPASCSYDPQKCEGWGPDEGTPGCAADEKIVDGECVPISETPVAWSARRAGPSDAALAVLGLAVGGSLLHSVWKNR